MKQRDIKYILSSLATALFLSACGGESSAEFEQTQETITLQKGIAQEVNKGDRLVKEDDDTIIRVVHELGNDIKSVTLLTGSAKLIRGNYETTN